MFKYTEKTGLIRKARQLFGSEWYTERFVSLVESQPVVDVALVRRGEWLDLRGDYQTAKCSFCASQYEVTFGEESNGMLFDGFKRFYKYCPHCGAKMEVGNG